MHCKVITPITKALREITLVKLVYNFHEAEISERKQNKAWGELRGRSLRGRKSKMKMIDKKGEIKKEKGGEIK